MPDRPVGLLGRLPGQIPVGLNELGYYAAGPLPKAPTSVAVPTVAPWAMLANDVVGDCGVAGLEHGFMADAWLTAQVETEANDAQAKAYYFTYTDGQDSGVVLSQYLAYVRQHGYYGHSVDSYAPVGVHDVPTLQTAIFCYGFAYTGIIVTGKMQQSFAANQPWTTGDLVGIGSTVLGGHCIPLVGYDESFVYAVTWGAVQAITWNCWHYISQEAWAIVTGEFIAAGGDTRGLNLTALRADLNQLGA